MMRKGLCKPCYDALLSANLVGESGKVIGVDFSEEMINNANSRNYNNVKFKHSK